MFTFNIKDYRQAQKPFNVYIYLDLKTNNVFSMPESRKESFKAYQYDHLLTLHSDYIPSEVQRELEFILPDYRKTIKFWENRYGQHICIENGMDRDHDDCLKFMNTI